MSITAPRTTSPPATATRRRRQRRQLSAACEAAEQHSRAAAEAVRRRAREQPNRFARRRIRRRSTFRRSTEAVAKLQRQMAQDAAERLNVVSRGVAEATRETTEDIRTLMPLPSVADRGMRDLQQLAPGLVNIFIVQTNLRATEELVQLLPNPISFLEDTAAVRRGRMNVVMEGSAAFARAMRRTIDREFLRCSSSRLGERQRTRADHPAQTTRRSRPRRVTAARR